MADLELCYSSANELVRRIRTMELSPVEVVRNSLERIEDVNPKLNCFCFTCPEEALDKAHTAEQAVMSGDELGPLHGVPIAIKDLTPTKGKTTTLGSKVYADWAPDEDAQVVKDLIGAGAIMVGKTTTSEFAHSGFTHSPLWGVTRNPWNTDRTPGGSSGGSGAAVASGCVPLAEGSDAGGSVRIPAAVCGTVGLKPSLGRIPMTVLPTVYDNITHIGPLARTIDDAAIFLAATQGPFELDIMSVGTPINVEVPVPSDVRGMKLALSEDMGFVAVEDDVLSNLHACADALRDAGAEVDVVDVRWDNSMVEAWEMVWAVWHAAYFRQHLQDRRHDLSPAVVSLIEMGSEMSAVDFKKTEFVRTKQWHKLCRIFETYDALLCPTCAMTAQPAENTDDMYGEQLSDGRYRHYEMAAAFNNVSQCPALSVPSGWSSDGLPTALQIVGHRFDDLTALLIGAAVENVRPWADRRPDI